MNLRFLLSRIFKTPESDKSDKERNFAINETFGNDGKVSIQKEIWESIGGNLETAFSMMDGSRDEKTLQERGRRVAQKLKKGLSITEKDRVLEIGCGVGRIGAQIAPYCHSWYGVDISNSLIEIAKHRTSHLDNVEFRVLNQSGSLDIFAEDFFDKVYSHIVFCHLDKEDVYLYLKEIARVLKSGGIAYYDTFNLMSESGWQRWLLEIEFYKNDPESRTYRSQWCTPAELDLYTEKAGLKLIYTLDKTFLLQVLATKFEADIANQEIDGKLEKMRKHLKTSLNHLSPSPRWDSHWVGVPFEYSDYPFGFLDRPAEGEIIGDSYPIAGWALNDVDYVEVWMNNVCCGRANYGEIREDLARTYPSFPNSKYSGFTYTLDTQDIPKGNFDIFCKVFNKLGNYTTLGPRKVSIE